MVDSSPHNEDIPSSIAGIRDTGNLPVPLKSQAATIKRQGYLSSHHKNSSSLLALIIGMGPNTLYVPFANAHINDLKQGNMGPYDAFAALILNTYLDNLDFLTWREDALFDALPRDQEAHKFALGEAKKLMRHVMSQDQINAFMARHNLSSRHIDEAA